MILQEISTSQLLERIRDLRTKVTGFALRNVPQSLHDGNGLSHQTSKSYEPVFKIPQNTQPAPISPENEFFLKTPETPIRGVSPPPAQSQAQPQGQSAAWAKTRLVENGLALTGELKNWQVRAESGNSETATMLDPEEFRAVVQVADAALRLIPSFPNEPEQLEPLAQALETILQPLKQKIASWHLLAKEFFDLSQMAMSAKTAKDPGQRSALAATLVRFSQKTGRLGLWLLPWDILQPPERMILAEAWLASTAAFKGGVWAMHEAAFEALQGKTPPIPPLWGSWLADLETGKKASGPWLFCQTIENGVGESHPLAGEWIPVEHPVLGILLLVESDVVKKGQNCRALLLQNPSGTERTGTSIVLTPQDLTLIRDLPHAKLRSLLARMLLGGQRP